MANAKADAGKPGSKAKPAPAAKKATVKPKSAASAKKPAAKTAKVTDKKPVVAKAPVKTPAKPAAKSAAPTAKPKEVAKAAPSKAPVAAPKPAPAKAEPEKALLKGFLKSQHQRLLDLRDSLLDQMSGVARDTLRSRAEGNEASAFGMHQADAGSDSYDRDFALNLLSQEQDALYEIEEAIKRVENGTYGICEMSGERIPQARLEALPFARFTVTCQEQLEQQQQSGHYRTPVTSLFGLSEADTAAAEAEDEA